jgi:arginine deiminase
MRMSNIAALMNVNVPVAVSAEHAFLEHLETLLGDGWDVVGTSTSVGVANDTGVLRDVLVQSPLGSHSDRSGVLSDVCIEAHRRHSDLVQELIASGISVRHLDMLLASALDFADARDWVLERRVREYEGGYRRASEIIGWLSEQPVQSLTRFLIDGLQTSDLPPGFNREDHGADNLGGWFLPPLDGLARPRRKMRFLDGGAIIAQPAPGASRAEAINISAVLNFAPLFDEARFEFWLAADGADRTCPPIDGCDLAMLTGNVYVAAITRSTSAKALSLLAVSLFHREKAEVMYWIDLTATGCASLDDCFLPLSHDCLLVDTRVLSMASASVVRASGHGAALLVEPCAAGFMTAVLGAQSAGLKVMDMNAYPGPVGDALSKLAPIVISPGRIIAFEEHSKAFPALERQGIEIVSALRGSCLSQDGKGPRDLVTALLVEPALA